MKKLFLIIIGLSLALLGFLKWIDRESDSIHSTPSQTRPVQTIDVPPVPAQTCTKEPCKG